MWHSQWGSPNGHPARFHDLSSMATSYHGRLGESEDHEGNEEQSGSGRYLFVSFVSFCSLLSCRTAIRACTGSHGLKSMLRGAAFESGTWPARISAWPPIHSLADPS